MERIRNKTVRDLPADGRFWIEEVGYNDFGFTRAIKVFRRQFFHTIHVILDGEGTLEIGGSIYKLQEGNVFYVPPDIPFRYYPREGNEWKYIWFVFRHKSAVEAAEKAGFGTETPVGRLADFENRVDIYRDFIIKAERNRKTVFLCQAMFLYSLSDFIKGDIEYGLDERYYFKRANDYIRNNCFDVEFRISHVSEYMHLSAEYFSRLFKKETGITVVNFVRDLRMERATELLSDTDYPVKRVSVMCGYGDYSHFCREFRKKYGITAMEYREKNHVER